MKKLLENQRRIPKQQRARAKYEAVLDACTQVLLEKGYNKATMFELSLVSGVAVPTIYQYFNNKEEVFRLWFSRVGERVFDDLLQEAISTEDGDVVRAYLKAALSSILAQRQGAKVLLDEFPQALSTSMMVDLEQQTLAFIGKLLVFDEQQLESERLKLLVRMMLGYMMQLVFYSEQEIDIEFESNELASIIYYYLSKRL